MTNDPGRTASGGLGNYAALGDSGRDRSMGDVLKDIFGNIQEMVRAEIRLARAEMREEAGKTAASAKMLGAGAVLALFGMGFVLVALTQALALVMPTFAASLVMGGLLAIVGLALISSGKNNLKAPTPHKTIENVKENVEWMKKQTK
ncbi:MAG: phage holin family protein [Bryobacteraceae bacterium]|nr:phage holin family protein [Bryobacteraceae bacterium]